MTENTTTLSYASPMPQITCPLCHTRPAKKLKLYGQPVCKKCYYGFANRRQIAYIVDGLLIAIPNVLTVLFLEPVIATAVGIRDGLLSYVLGVLFTLPLLCLFMMKDGFGGQSPGKYLTGVQVLDAESGEPISFGQSFKRYWFLLFGLVPVIGGLVSGVIVIVAGVQLAKGYRIGDKFAHTRVIWRKFAELPPFAGNALTCEACGYNLRANTSGTCPECGSTVSMRNIELLAAGPQT